MKKKYVLVYSNSTDNEIKLRIHIKLELKIK
jgi:hypothetical protein